jgi:hypothetical protein
VLPRPINGDLHRIETVCRALYPATKAMRHLLGEHDQGFSILHGPPIHRAPVMFIGYQPGGNYDAALLPEEEGWPPVNRSAWVVRSGDHKHTLSRNLRSMFGPEFLARCVTTNINFFRAKNMTAWRRVPLEARRQLEHFCRAQVLKIIPLIEPRLVVANGFATMRQIDPDATAWRHNAGGRVLMTEGRIGGTRVLATLHLSGCRISDEDRALIARAILGQSGGLEEGLRPPGAG